MTKLETAYGKMIATMERDTSLSQTRRFLTKKTREPHSFYGFIASTAIEWLAENEDMLQEEAMKLLNKFVVARLLHFPDDRMCMHVKNDGMEMQPTAKGFAYVEEWFRSNADTVSERQKEFLVAALASPYNSMELIRLERSLLSETPLLSTGLAMWLWQRMLGENPHLFDGTFRKSDKETLRRNALTIFNANSIDLSAVLPLTTSDRANIKTPYWNGAMIHPSSSSTMQYWDSQGLRLFKTLEFERPLKSKFSTVEQYSVSLCMSGKAMWQWIMECTTAENPGEAAKIVKMFVDQRFVQPISDRIISWATYKDNFPKHVSRLTFYRFTQRGMRLCAWEDLIDVAAIKPSNFDHDEENAIRWMLSGGPSQSELADARTWAWSFVDKPTPLGLDESFKQLVTLDLINREPGLKVPFRKKLVEWHCEENLRYLDDSQRTLLLLKASRSAKGTITRLNSLQSQVCKNVFDLKRLYIQPGSPFELNLSQELRDSYLRCVRQEVAMEYLLDHIQGPLEQIQTECMILLRDQVSRFLLEDELRHLPLSAYVVGSYKGQ